MLLDFIETRNVILNLNENNVINLETGRELSYNKENLLNPYFIIKA